MFALWTEWTNVAWTVVHQTMADHLILTLEAFAAFGARAARNWAVVWSTLAVHILVGASEYSLAGDRTLEKCYVRYTLADIASEKFQPYNLGRRICTARVS